VLIRGRFVHDAALSHDKKNIIFRQGNLFGGDHVFVLYVRGYEGYEIGS
jgi:hypothetical protein